MIDIWIAKWVNWAPAKQPQHNSKRSHPLTPFAVYYTSLRNNDFPNYMNWVMWCRESAGRLNAYGPTTFGHPRRPRDTEMATFTAWGGRTQRRHLPIIWCFSATTAALLEVWPSSCPTAKSQDHSVSSRLKGVRSHRNEGNHFAEKRSAGRRCENSIVLGRHRIGRIGPVSSSTTG